MHLTQKKKGMKCPLMKQKKITASTLNSFFWRNFQLWVCEGRKHFRTGKKKVFFKCQPTFKKYYLVILGIVSFSVISQLQGQNVGGQSTKMKHFIFRSSSFLFENLCSIRSPGPSERYIYQIYFTLHIKFNENNMHVSFVLCPTDSR